MPATPTVPATPHSSGTAQQRAVADEQRYLDLLHQLRERELADADADLAQPADPDDDPLARQAHRDAVVARRAELRRAEAGLYFGRIDDAHGNRHLGRVGLRGAPGDFPPGHDPDDPLLIDWRAPAARAFYTATAKDPQGLLSRRHIRTEGRTVIGVDDEALSGAAAVDTALVGEAALLRVLEQRRTGAMGDIVATLQAEQDAIVRAPREGGVVVQGGPGTGKTAVALHRAAYLLFAHPRIAERGVLIVGPSQRFLTYIGQVLPVLGETQVVGITPDALLPGIAAAATDADDAAEVKGRKVWAEILRRAADELLPAPTAVAIGIAGEDLVLDRDRVAQLLRQADAADGPATLRRLLVSELSRLAVAQAQRQFDDVERGFEDILATVDRSMAAETGEQHAPLRAVEPVQIRRQVAGDPALDDVVRRLRPAIDPQDALRTLLTDPEFLSRTAPTLTAAERALVLRGRDDKGWSAADIALLDELAALLHWPGPHTSGTGADGRARAGAETADDAAELTLAERAARDPRWAYGHVIVDEAQELSDMQWRAISRRCPAGSVTAVGDVNQVEAPGGHSDWSQALTPVLGRRWRRTDLTVCYRTPQQVMSVAAAALSAAGASVAPPTSVRPGRVAPWERTVTAGATAVAAAGVLDRWHTDYDGGQFAVIAPPSRLPALRQLASAQVSVLTPQQSKGLEFDAVLLVDPVAMAGGRRGSGALYVAMTRCTQELGSLHVTS